MSEQRVVVPKGMLEAAIEATRCARWQDGPKLEYIAVEAALRWLLSDVLTPESRRIFDAVQSKMKLSWKFPGDDSFCSMLDYLERRFVAPPEPEVPEAVKDLLWEYPSKVPYTVDGINTSILTAYRRGLAAERGK